ncbi:TonB-dependent receptor plug domain-containing protein [Thalassotalea sp. M1531]|uniref:TonB-dependent receptor plug domain-containing protein n=1 Tax=Thalassotalea algicola TaxID=2716224 RepID=A0A7Y0L973_9GAMM|nr:TonB-dependent receptor plug domain-containing protein [Thalassotalea algicola]NMP30097.1 TonB-dependent receptor plug domain-containing protein [Thalassotalea algicola]
MNNLSSPSFLVQSIKAALLSSVFAIPTAFAAENDDAAKDENSASEIEHIEVTSRLRKESIDKIPVSVISFNLEDMEKAGMEDINDIASNAIGFSMEKTFGRQADIPVMRGVSWIPGFGTQKASYFIDGVYFSGSIQSLPLDLIERVEIIKGPQSALYGRSTFSGAINLITRKPGDKASGYVTATYGKNGNQQLAGGISSKITDTLSFRASGSLDQYDGDWKNEKEGGPSLGGEKTKSAMLGLYYNSERTDVALNFIYNENDDEHSVFMFQDPSYNNCYLDTRAYYCGEAKTDLPINIGGILDNSDYGLRSEREHISLKIDHSFDFGDLSWSTAINTYDTENGVDQTYTGYEQAFSFGFFFGGPYFGSAAGWHTLGEGQSDEISHEVRFSSTAFDDRLYWMVGAYYWEWEDDPEDADAFVAKNSNQALMASVSYDITDDFNISVEARKATDEIETQAYENLIQDPTYADVDNEFDSTTTRIIAEYNWDEHLFYLTRSEGNSPGDFNSDSNLPIELIKVEEEEMVMYEFGWKSTLLDGALYLSTAAFFMDWDDQQLTDSYIDESAGGGDVPISYISNKGETEVKGVEIQGKWLVNENFDIDFGFSYTNSEFVEAFDGNHCRIISGLSSSECNQPANLTTYGDISGNTPPQVPEKEANLAFNYKGEIDEDTGWFARLSASYDSSRYAHIHNFIETGSRTKVDLRAGINHGGVTLTAWAKNLTDDETPTYIFRYIDAQSFAFSSRAFPIAPSRGREFGVTMKYSF